MYTDIILSFQFKNVFNQTAKQIHFNATQWQNRYLQKKVS